MGLANGMSSPFERAVNFGRRSAQRVWSRARQKLRLGYRAIGRMDLAESVEALRSDVAALHDAQRAMRSEFAAQMSFFSHDLTQTLGTSSAQSSERLDNLRSAASEVQNRLIHLDTSLHSRLNEVLNLHFPGLLEQLHQLSAFEITIANRGRTQVTTDSKRHSAADIKSFDATLARARQEFPTVFAAWKERLDEHSSALAITEHGNAANSTDVYSRLFRAFVEHHVDGAVLDVGCGPTGKPFYLASYPSQLISGIDPLTMQRSTEIEFVQGISEYLPWPEKSFSTVISATALDHCISLDRSLDEMARVLRPGGKILLWLGSIPGSPPYRPLDPAFVPADRFHLFHFDIGWMEPLLEQRFQLLDRVKLDRAGYSHVFYCLCLRQ